MLELPEVLKADWPASDLNVTTPSEDLSPMAVAMQWSTRVMTISLEMVVPGLLGYWADRKLGTVVVFTLLGFAIGCTSAVWHLIRMTSAASKGGPASSKEKGSKEQGMGPPR